MKNSKLKDYDINARDKNVTNENVFQLVNSLGEAMGSLENFTHLIPLPRNCILIIPIGINYTANFEARIVFLNAI